MRHALRLLLCAVFSMALFAGCGSTAPITAMQSRYQPSKSASDDGNRQTVDIASALSASGHASAVSGETPVFRAQQPSESRLKIYSGAFRLSTTDIDATADQLTTVITGLGGYLQSRNDDQLVLRLPSGQFQAMVDRLDEFGTVISRSVEASDVTDEYKDLGLRLSVLAASRQRLMALIERAANVEDLIKLEEQLTELTTRIESLTGSMKRLDSQIAFSRIEVHFTKRSFTQQNQSSPFAWVNQLGPDNVLKRFKTSSADEPMSVDKLLKGFAPMEVPDGFVAVKSTRKELQAVSPDDARVWYREFPVRKGSSRQFWAKAVRNHLVNHLGCHVVDESQTLESGSSAGDSYQLLVTADSKRGPLLHLVTIAMKPNALWPGQPRVQVTEFTASPELFDEYSGAIGAASPFPVTVRTPRGEMVVSALPN